MADELKAWLFRTTEGQSGILTDRPHASGRRVPNVRRRAHDAGIRTKIGGHTFRATGITEY